MTETVRSASQRKADTVARLENDADVWMATASAGRPHLVPLSLAWDGARVIVATPARIDGRTIMRNGQWAAAWSFAHRPFACSSFAG